MENDWDLELSHQIESHQHFQQQNQTQPDLLLQPITTQGKFNINPKNKQSTSPSNKPNLDSAKQIQPLQEQIPGQKSLKDSQELAQEARKFRQYLNDKVEQLRKSKQQMSPNQKSSPEAKAKASNLRKIINKEELKSKQDFQQKIKPTSENVNPPKQTNSVNKTAIEIKRANETSTSSVGTYNNMVSKKEEHEKRFSNSQSSLAKNVQKKDAIHSKKTTVGDIKNSINLDNNSKTPKLPQLTPKLKIPFPAKNQPSSTQQRTDKRKNTIDEIIPRNLTQKQKRKTPQSKSSFRIKRTSNVSNTQTNVLPSQQKLTIDLKKSSEGSIKIIQKERQSPIHQGNNRKMREDFMKFNEEEKKIQQEILRYHQEGKKHLDLIIKKFQLSTENYKKYGIQKQAQFPSEPQTLSPKKSLPKESRIDKSQKQLQAEEKPSESTLKKQERKNKFLSDELEKINNLLKTRQNNINKYESRVERNALIQFMRSLPQDILEESEEDEIDRVGELPEQGGVKQDPRYDAKEFTSTYSSVMTEMKNKKWGLKQRITFETHRDPNDVMTGNKKSTQINENVIANSGKKAQQSGRLLQRPENQENSEPYSKIEVNSRLKNLLLD